MENNYTKRYVANIVFEAITPLKVGSSDVDMLQDSPVQKDWNELPMILGTSIAGVLRKEFDKKFADDIFGDERSKKKDNKGSRVIISNALLCDRDMSVIETLNLEKNDFLKIFDTLPIRDHTAINDKGVADSEKTAKFDEEVVYKGSRFRFRMELIADENDQENWQKLIKTINSKTFRLGGGTTKGFGDINILNEFSTYDVFDIDSEDYQKKSSSLNTTFSKPFPKDKKACIDYTTYTLKIKPDDFYMFGSGFGDDEADMTPVYEQVVVYDKNNPEKSGLSKTKILIPASSIKGALSHRTTYHYNLKKGFFIGDDRALKNIPEIFGIKKDDDQGKKGKVIFSDCFLDKADEKVFDHVAIDRFTGGAIEGALFQEKTIANTKDFSIEILLRKGIAQEYVEAFESALKDITTGMLPLGGATTKGHGVFGGKVYKDGVEI